MFCRFVANHSPHFELRIAFALANLSFDFAMIRLEAPLEYQGLGTALSKRRKHEAEQGSVHTTARRLGALFADDIVSRSAGWFRLLRVVS
jgi:hypothetical protein